MYWSVFRTKDSAVFFVSFSPLVLSDSCNFQTLRSLSFLFHPQDRQRSRPELDFVGFAVYFSYNLLLMEAYLCLCRHLTQQKI